MFCALNAHAIQTLSAGFGVRRGCGAKGGVLFAREELFFWEGREGGRRCEDGEHSKRGAKWMVGGAGIEPATPAV